MDIANIPFDLTVGDYISIIDENEQLFLKSRVQKLTYDYTQTSVQAELSDFKRLESGISQQLSDLADKLKEKLEEEVQQLYQEEREQKFNSNDFLKLFQHIKENQIFYKTYFKLGYDNDYQIFQYDINLAKKIFDNKFINYHIIFFKNGLNAIIKVWLQRKSGRNV